MSVMAKYIIEDGVVTFTSKMRIIFDGAFENNLNFVSVVIPEGVKSIGKRAFWCSDNLESVHIGKGVTFIGDSILFECNKMQKVSYGGTADDWSRIEIDFNQDLDEFSIEFATNP